MLPVEIVPIESLKPHPRNYREHPDDQVEHIVQSIDDHGVYRNIVIARDGTILAGHGVVVACKKKGMTEVPVYRIDRDPDHPLSLKLLAGDNEISHLGVINDRILTELLKDINETADDGLKGTGFDESMLANLLFVTRPKSEIQDIDYAAHDIGIPNYVSGVKMYALHLEFTTVEERKEFCEKIGIENFTAIREFVWSARYPFEGKQDRSSVNFE